MNIEVSRKWTLAPRAADNAIGAALRGALVQRADRLPDEFGALLNQLEDRRRRGAQAAMS